MIAKIFMLVVYFINAVGFLDLAVKEKSLGFRLTFWGLSIVWIALFTSTLMKI